MNLSSKADEFEKKKCEPSLKFSTDYSISGKLQDLIAMGEGEGLRNYTRR